MNSGFRKNLLTVITAVLLSLSTGSFAYFNPTAIEPAASPAISALSVIFGLSIAVSSIALASHNLQPPLGNDPSTNNTKRDRQKADDQRTLTRQKYLTWLALLALILGLIFLVAFKKAPCAILTRIIAATFSFMTSTALMFSLRLPGLLSSIALRNRNFSTTN